MSSTTTTTPTTASLSCTWMAFNKKFSFPIANNNEEDNDNENCIVHEEQMKNNPDSSSSSSQTQTQIQQQRREALFQYWKEATSFFALLLLSKQQQQEQQEPFQSQIIMEWFERLFQYHSESQRYYHTLVHLEEMLAYIDGLPLPHYHYHDNNDDDVDIDIANRIKIDNSKRNDNIFNMNRSKLILSTFFHDAIYNPKSSTNEEDSAQLFQQFCKEFRTTTTTTTTTASTGTTRAEEIQVVTTDTPQNDKDENKDNKNDILDVRQAVILESTIVQYILATKSHKADLLLKEAGSGDDDDDDQEIINNRLCGQYFLDVDMAVLGKTWSAYRSYASLIRKEYNFVDHAIYCNKRAEILEEFLQMPHLFHTPLFQSTVEDRARQNLQQEINILRRGLIPGQDKDDDDDNDACDGDKEKEEIVT